MMFKQLRTRIMLLSVALTSLIMLVAFSAIFLVTAGNLQMETHRKLNDLGHVGFVSFTHDDTLSSTYDYSFMLLVDDAGNLIDAYSRCSYPDSMAAFDEAARFAWNDSHAGSYQYFNSSWRYSISDDRNGLYNIAFIEVTSDETALNQLLLTLIAVGIATLVVILIFSRFFAGRVVRPIVEAWEQQKRFVADASHELKTPLMTILANYEVLESNEELTIRSQREWLEPIRVGADRMTRLVNHLLTLAHVEAGEIEERGQHFAIDEMIDEVVHSLDAACQAKNLCVMIDCSPQFEVFGFEDCTRQVFTALYENAVKYSDNGGAIEVHVKTEKRRITLTVRNTGKGIAAQDLPHIFERFYRTDTTRSAESGSYGLGLSIAYAAAQRVGGQLTAKSIPGKWTEMVFSFAIA